MIICRSARLVSNEIQLARHVAGYSRAQPEQDGTPSRNRSDLLLSSVIDSLLLCFDAI